MLQIRMPFRGYVPGGQDAPGTLGGSPLRTKKTGVAMKSRACLPRPFCLGKSLIVQGRTGVNGGSERHLTATPIQIARDARLAQRRPWRHLGARDFGLRLVGA